MGPREDAPHGWLRRLLASGCSRADSDEQARRVRAVNAFALGVSLITALHLWVLDTLTGEHALTTFGASLIVGLCVPVVLNAQGRFQLAALWLIVTACAGQVVFSLALGNDSGTYLGSIVWAAAGALLLDPARQRTLSVARALPVLVLFCTYVYGLSHPPWLDVDAASLDKVFHLVLTCVIVLMLVITSAHDAATRRRARELEKSHERAQQKLDRALRESEGRFGLLLQQAGDALLVVEEGGKVVDANARATVDLGADPTGRPIWDVDTTLSRAVLRPLTDELLAGTRYRAEHTYRRADGSTFLADVRAGAIDTEAGRQLLLSMRDTTEQRELQSQLLLAERLAAVGTLAAGVAHEINNPLSFIHMHVEMLRRRLEPYLDSLDEDDACAVHQSLERAAEGTHRVSRIVGDLMTFARGQDTDVGTADVLDVLRGTLSLAEPELVGHVRIVRDVAAVPPARASASRLGQVLLNLVLNARHALVEADVDDPTLTVRVRHVRPGGIEVSIADNGPGMSPEVASRVFEPFYTTKQAGSGTGLGLFVCRNLITEAGGSIELVTAPGEGACFTLRIPAASEEEMAEEAESRRSGVRGREQDATRLRTRRNSQAG